MLSTGNNSFLSSSVNGQNQSGSNNSVDFLTVNNNFNKTACNIINDRYTGKFVSPNVVNLSGRKLSTTEISLLSKGLKFAPTPNYINRAVLNEELETFGRKLRSMWHFRYEENSPSPNPFRRKSKFNPIGKDAPIKLYLSCLEEETLAIDTKLNYSNITKEEGSTSEL